jgi:hypothetical protein
MKLEAVFNRDGVMLAAVAFDPNELSPRPRPVASEGDSLGEFDVPAEYADAPLDEICRALRVDVASGRLVNQRESTRT